MKYIYCILVVCIFTTCNSDRKGREISEKVDIDSVLVTYYCGMMDSNVAIKCGVLAVIQADHPPNDYTFLKEGIVELIDTFIVDKPILKEIESLLKKKEPIETYKEDARMYVSIKYSNGETDNICLGMNTPQALFNGEPMLIEDNLIYIFRLNSGYYQWFSEKDLESFKEYRDFYHN